MWMYIVCNGIFLKMDKIFKFKVCIICGKEFIPTNGKQKYCKDCRPIIYRELRRIKMARYRITHPDRCENYQKQFYLKHSEQYKQHKQWDEYNKQWRKEHSEQVRESWRKHYNKRERSLDFIPLNEFFEGAEAHHLDNIYVIYIPKEVHRSVYHSVFKNIGMDEINALAWNYL